MFFHCHSLIAVNCYNMYVQFQRKNNTNSITNIVSPESIYTLVDKDNFENNNLDYKMIVQRTTRER